jgi:hypothetical protein
VHAVVLPSEHWPHAPEGWQAGVAPEQSTSPPHARHACVVVLQTGVVPPQFAFDVQGTHVAVPTLQAGVAPEQAVLFVAEHWPQAPLAWQAGVAPPQSVSLPQARQAWVVVLQTGVEPPHCAFETQGTHVPAVV